MMHGPINILLRGADEDKKLGAVSYFGGKHYLVTLHTYLEYAFSGQLG